MGVWFDLEVDVVEVDLAFLAETGSIGAAASPLVLRFRLAMLCVFVVLTDNRYERVRFEIFQEFQELFSCVGRGIASAPSRAETLKPTKERGCKYKY